MSQIKCSIILLCFMVTACGEPDVARYFERHLWKQPVILVFTPSENGQDYQQQMRILKAYGLRASDTALYEVVALHHVKRDGGVLPALTAKWVSEHFNISPDRFGVLVLGTDGEEKLRSAEVVTETEINAAVGQ